MARYELVVVADDITGATDTGVQVSRRGFDTSVVTRSNNRPESDVLVVDTDSRDLPSEEAYRRVAAVNGVLDAIPYKKIDSTLRGNLTSEISALVDSTAPDLVVVAPAFPDAGRSTIQGSQYVEGTPVHLSEFDGPETRRETSHLPTILSALPCEIYTLGLDDIERGASHVRRRFQACVDDSDRAVVVCDATDDSHLSTIAAGTEERNWRVAYVGSGGLIAHVAITPVRRDGIVLGVVGSVTNVAFSQLRSLPEERVVRLDPEILLTGSRKGSERVFERLDSVTGSRSYIVITGAVSREHIEQTIALGRKRGLSDAEIRDRVVRTLECTVRSVHASRTVSGLFVTGGATYRAVLDAVDASSLSLPGIELESGVPIATIDDGPMSGRPVISKAGGFGDDNTISNCLHFLCGQ